MDATDAVGHEARCFAVLGQLKQPAIGLLSRVRGAISQENGSIGEKVLQLPIDTHLTI